MPAAKQHDWRKVDVSAYIERKGNLSYVSWASAWDAVLAVDPDATWEPLMNDGNPLWPAGSGWIVRTQATVNGVTKSCPLPVLDHRNKSVSDPDAFQVNTSIMRCLAKNLAMFGLGLYVYRGEDLPPDEVGPTHTPADMLTSATTVKELAARWAKLPKDAKAELAALKDECKARLSEAA